MDLTAATCPAAVPSNAEQAGVLHMQMTPIAALAALVAVLALLQPAICAAPAFIQLRTNSAMEVVATG